MDLMEYPTPAAAQAAYVSSDATPIIHLQQTDKQADAVDWYSFYGADGTYEMVGEIFQPTADIVCPQIKVWFFKKESPTDNVFLTIEGDDGSDHPDGTPIATSNNIAGGDISTSGTEYTFTFSTPAHLANGTKYHYVLQRDGARDTTNYYKANISREVPPNTVNTRHNGSWSTKAARGVFKIYHSGNLQCYSENTIIQQGTYSLKVIAQQTGSLNDTLTRTVDPTLNLSNIDKIKLYVYASRMGSNFKIGFHDSGGTTTEYTINVLTADSWQLIEIDISGVANADKDVIDQIIITILNADADNTAYFDNMFTNEDIVKTYSETLTLSEPSMSKGMARNLSDLLSLSEDYSRVVALTKTFAETVTLSEPSFIRAMTRIWAEVITLTEVAQKAISIVIRDEDIGLLDIFSRIKKKFWHPKSVAPTSWSEPSPAAPSWMDGSQEEPEWQG